MTVRGKNAALPYFLLVDNEFHRLHRILRSASKRNDQENWQKAAHKFAENVTQTLQHEVLCSDIERTPSKQLPKGTLSFPESQGLLKIYRRARGTWNDFRAGTDLQKRLVCQICVESWIKKYRSGKIDWNQRAEKDGNAYIVGKQGKHNDCYIKFNIQGFAVHPDKVRAPKIEAGYRCNGSEKTLMKAKEGVKLKVSGNNYSWSELLFFKELPNEFHLYGKKKDLHYGHVIEELTVIADMLKEGDFNQTTNKLTRFDCLISLKRDDQITRRNIAKDAYFNFDEFSNKEALILEGVATKRKGGFSVKYIIHDANSSYITTKFSDLNKDSGTGLGLYLFVKQRHLVGKNELKLFKDIGLAITEDLGRLVGWKENEGQLYSLNNEIYDSAEESAENKGEIDLNSLNSISPLIRKLKERNPKINLPTLKSSLKYIQAFVYTNGTLQRIQSNKRLTIDGKSRMRILVRVVGFKLKDTTLELEIFPESLAGNLIQSSRAENMENGFASFRVPGGKKTTVYRINLNARDKIGIPMTFELNVTGNENPYPPERVNLQSEYEDNETIIKTYNTKKLVAALGIDENNAGQLLKKGRYMELIKNEISKNSEKLFTVPTSRIQQRYIGLDFISFGSPGGELELGQRLRSSGLYFPVPPEMDNGDDSRYLSTNKWDAFEDHIVRLDSNFHLLLTASPLDSWGISLDEDTLKQKGLIVTNHGTFIKGKIPNELSEVEIVERPKFLDLYAKTPGQHFDTLNKIIDTIPKEKRESYNKHLNQYFVVTHEFQPTGNKWRVWGNNAIPPRSSWSPVSKLNLSEMGITKSPLKAEHQNKNIVFFDVVFIERKSGDERQILVRRHHENGEVDYLSIARFIKQNADYWAQNQLEWVSDIERNDIQELEHLFLWIGGKFKGQDLKRAYDWNFLQIETLRAFTSISNQAVKDNVLKWVRPVPLYKYLDGGVKGDLMQGLLQDPVLRHNTALKQAVDNAVRRWTWTQKSGEN